MAIDWTKPWAPVFLLRVDARGSYTYLATERLDLFDADDNEYRYNSGLMPLEWTYKLNIGEFSSSSDTISIQFTNPFFDEFSHVVNCYALDLSTIQGELSLYVNGLYEDRIILASGRLQRIRWGYEGDLIEAQLLVNPFKNQRMIPQTPQIIDERRWQNVPENRIGVQYPLVFGSPGSTDRATHPAILIDSAAHKWVVAGHSISAETVSVFNRTTGYTTSKIPTIENDDRNQTVTTINYTPTSDTDEVWVRVSGGLIGRNPADQLAYCLDAAGIDYDQSSLIGLRGALAQYTTGFVLNDQTDAWSLAADRIAAILPLSMQVVGSKVVFSHIKPIPTESDVAADLDAQRGDITLIKSPEIVESDITNRVSINYAADPSTDVSSTLIVTGFTEQNETNSKLSVSKNALADLSQNRLGVFEKSLSTDILHDAASAGRVAHDLIDLYALPRIEIEYEVSGNSGQLKIGDFVRITDSDFEFTNKYFRVISMAYSLDRISATLASIEHPSLRQLATCAEPVFPDSENQFIAIANGAYHAIALKSDGTVWSWGFGGYGALGHGNTDDVLTPLQISGFSDVIAIAAGDYHSLAIKSDGTVWAWGDNSSGQLGDGSTTQRTSPVAVVATNLTGATAIAAGESHSLAIKSDGTVWAWGNNNNGRLGDNTTTQRTSPVAVVATNLTGATAIAAGESHSLAIKTDGTVWAWGSNSNGQLGDNSTTQRLSPVAVVATNLTGAIKISAGTFYSLAIKTDGTVWAWGENARGKLGDNTTTQRKTPVAVVAANLSSATEISAGDYHSLAIKSDGTVWAWGDNSNGQLGDNTTTQRNSPVAVVTTNLTTATKISAGGYYSAVPFDRSLAIRADGTVWAWGENSYGWLGDGTIIDQHEPVQVIF